VSELKLLWLVQLAIKLDSLSKYWVSPDQSENMLDYFANHMLFTQICFYVVIGTLAANEELDGGK
jgi:hypothetical protein